MKHTAWNMEKILRGSNPKVVSNFGLDWVEAILFHGVFLSESLLDSAQCQNVTSVAQISFEFSCSIRDICERRFLGFFQLRRDIRLAPFFAS
jgi:hypothetical protein